MKPVVCITPSIFDGPDKGHKLINMKYAHMLEGAGLLPLTCDYDDDAEDTSQLLDMCHGLVLTGGYDIDPVLYGQKAIEGADKPHPDRDMAEFELLRQAIARDMPVLGICRGMQVINVLFGGSLWQDVNTQGATDFKHSEFEAPQKDIHNIRMVGSSALRDALGADTFQVNSCHHQAIRTLSPALKAAGYSHDGLIEAVYMPSKTCVWGVQWHPESLYLTHPEEFRLAKKFAAACARFAEEQNNVSLSA